MTMPKKKQPVVGRPPSPFEERYAIRHNDEQLAAWKAAAQLDDRELQGWIRHTLDTAAAKARAKVNAT